jgi:2-polyprenyl-3-methyl-5-hydroxy-6-metoxy-1,4-benzoquinol methylase
MAAVEKAIGGAGEACRLCYGPAEEIFRVTVLARLDVAIQRCRTCGSAQTETPYWLDESYYENRVGPGVDAPARGSWMQAQTLIIARLFGFGPRTKVLDFGGGTGLLARMLRDIGFDAYRYDLYERNVFCPGFDGKVESGWDVVTAVEVLEHLPNPAETLTEILSMRPKIVIATTEFYRGEGKD